MWGGESGWRTSMARERLSALLVAIAGEIELLLSGSRVALFGYADAGAPTPEGGAHNEHLVGGSTRIWSFRAARAKHLTFQVVQQFTPNI